MTERLREYTLTSGVTMMPPGDVRAAVAGRSVELVAIDRLAPGIDDVQSGDARIPAAVAIAFRRAVRRVKLGMEFSPPADIAAPEHDGTVATVCEAVRRVHAYGRCGPVSGGATALQVLARLRQAFVDELDALRSSLKPGELWPALHAFDQVREAIERDETQRFVAALESGEALDLVVEIAHDMRSPLTAILMLTETIRRAQASAEAARAEQLALVYSAAFGLNALVNDVIALARGGDRLIDRQPVPFSTSALMHSVADMLRPIAEERRLGLRVATPALDGRVGQPIAISRVLLNLASNALKYTDTGEVAIMAIDLCPNHVRFEVADTGPGIPADVMPTLFEPFGKRPTMHRARRFSRTGLGLAICRKLLRDMGSELCVESAPDSGTRFSFELPLPVADDGCVPRGDIGGSLL